MTRARHVATRDRSPGRIVAPVGGARAARRTPAGQRAVATLKVLSPASILDLQRSVGNATVTTLIEHGSSPGRGRGAAVQRAPLPAAADPKGFTQPQGVKNVAGTGLTRLEVHGLAFGISGG